MSDTGETLEVSDNVKASIQKDKTCPWCGQAFTSSSLGRHLDGYIKEHNPKPSDGVHDVEEIRKLRGNVTRRQTRNSSTKRKSSTPGGTPEPSSKERRTTAPEDSIRFETLIPHEPLTTRLNKLPWTATGVIPDALDSSPPTQSVPPIPGIRSLQEERAQKEQENKDLEERDTSRATELALQEVLANIKAACAKVERTSPLDFNPMTMSFPELCLKCLPAPRTLFSTQPFATEDSWTLEPPGPRQLDVLVRHIRSKYHGWQLEHPSLHANGMPNGFKDIIATDSRLDEEKIVNHIIQASNHWFSLLTDQRAQSWQLEIMRAYTREQQKGADLQTRLDEAHKDIQYLRNQIDQLNRLQLPSEFRPYPPGRIPISQVVAAQLQWPRPVNSDGIAAADADPWDHDRLVAKWKGVILERRANAPTPPSSSAVAIAKAQSQLPDPPSVLIKPSNLPKTSSRRWHSVAFPSAREEAAVRELTTPNGGDAPANEGENEPRARQRDMSQTNAAAEASADQDEESWEGSRTLMDISSTGFTPVNGRGNR